jgi:hypothetical protein
LLASAEMGNGTVVTPDARELCYTADNARHRANADKYGTDYTEPLFGSGQPHLMRLATGISGALQTIDVPFPTRGEGHDGYKVADFNVDQSVDEALKKFGPATPAHNQQVVQAQVVIGSNGQPITLKNPYTHTSQEFLRHHLLKDFEGTMKRNEDVEGSAQEVARDVTAFNAAIAAKPKGTTARAAAESAKAESVDGQTRKVNAAATGAILNISGRDSTSDTV